MTHAEKYPEHIKLKAISNQSQAIGDFIVWMQDHGYYVCERREAESADRLDTLDLDFKTAKSMGELFCKILDRIIASGCVYWPISSRLPETLLAEYFEIDQDKLEAEKRAMLDEMRAANT